MTRRILWQCASVVQIQCCWFSVWKGQRCRRAESPHAQRWAPLRRLKHAPGAGRSKRPASKFRSPCPKIGHFCPLKNPSADKEAASRVPAGRLFLPRNWERSASRCSIYGKQPWQTQYLLATCLWYGSGVLFVQLIDNFAELKCIVCHSLTWGDVQPKLSSEK